MTVTHVSGCWCISWALSYSHRPHTAAPRARASSQQDRQAPWERHITERKPRFLCALASEGTVSAPTQE